MGYIRIRESVGGRILKTYGDAPEEVLVRVEGRDGVLRSETVNLPRLEEENEEKENVQSVG